MAKIERRIMLKTLGGISLGSLIPVLGLSSNVDKKSGKRVKALKTDVMVIGGGTAGIIAAIQSARAGCSTIIVENGSQLGGTITTGGVTFPGLFHAWGKQIISGIGWELVTETVKMDDGTLPDFKIPTGPQHGKHQISLNGYLYSLLTEEKCIDAGVSIRYYETPVTIQFNKNNWEVETIGKGSKTKITCNQLIDCTGNGFVTSLAGYRVLREEETQPGTLQFKIGGYNYDQLDIGLIRDRYNEAVKKKELIHDEFRSIDTLLKGAGNNIQHIFGADSTTSETHTITNISGRNSLLKMLRFLRTLPGCENIQIITMQPETAVRETYRIEGEYQITNDDYVSGKVFEDSVSYSFYPIDLHGKHGVTPKHLVEEKVATIPLRALVPKNSLNLLVAGRCISSDRLANSALCVQASCMAMGQSAGAAAALANKFKTTPLEVPVDDIKSLLHEHGGLIPDKNI